MGTRGQHWDGQNATLKPQTGTADSMGGRWREMKDEVGSWAGLREWQRDVALRQAVAWAGRLEDGRTTLHDRTVAVVRRHVKTLREAMA